MGYTSKIIFGSIVSVSFSFCILNEMNPLFTITPCVLKLSRTGLLQPEQAAREQNSRAIRF